MPRGPGIGDPQREIEKFELKASDFLNHKL